MSAILYKLVDGKVVQEKANALDVPYLLDNGYSACPKQLLKRKEVDTNETGKLSNKEIKEAAKKEGIKIGGKSIAKIREELGL